MLDALGADILCLLETKAQPSDITDDMVLVPGWDSYFSFAKFRMGYSGVAIYTRLGVCRPLRAEEGVTGILDSRICPGTPCKYLSAAEVIGGYPELSDAAAFLLDSEGRAIALDFGAFVLLAVCCPDGGSRDRDAFRQAFVHALLCRIQNLIAQGRHVVLAGGLNVTRHNIDVADTQNFVLNTSPADWEFRVRLRRLLEPHPNALMSDLCREHFSGTLSIRLSFPSSKPRRVVLIMADLQIGMLRRTRGRGMPVCVLPPPHSPTKLT